MDIKSTIGLNKAEERRFLSKEDLKASKQRSGDLTGLRVVITGSGNCVSSNKICFPVPQQSEQSPGWGIHAPLWLWLFAHMIKQIVELPKSRRALGARCGAQKCAASLTGGVLQ